MRSMAKPGTDFGRRGQQRGGAADGQPLVADLRGGGDGNLVDAVGRQRRVAPEQLADAAHDEVVGACLGVDAVGAGLAEGSAHAVDEDDLTQRAGHGTSADVDTGPDPGGPLKLPVGNHAAKHAAPFGRTDAGRPGTRRRAARTGVLVAA
jgi:hypothetical protein